MNTPPVIKCVNMSVACKLLGVTRTRLYCHTMKGNLVSHTDASGRTMYDVDDLAAWADREGIEMLSLRELQP